MKAYLDEIRKKYPDCPIKRENIIYINSTIPGKIWVNTVRVPGCDGSDIESLTDGEVQGLLQIPGIVKTLKDYVPGFEDCVLDEIAPPSEYANHAVYAASRASTTMTHWQARNLMTQ